MRKWNHCSHSYSRAVAAGRSCSLLVVLAPVLQSASPSFTLPHGTSPADFVVLLKAMGRLRVVLGVMD
ncbi:UNVERIFIED_CONTAM: hypothetical protein K2H54_019021 [Gekko kuhli]